MIINGTYGKGGSGGLLPRLIISAPAGSSITIDGNHISKTGDYYIYNCERYGDFVIVSTNGIDTATETIYVDEIKIYNITINYRLYLYNSGDECTSLTGGWIQASHESGNPSSRWGNIVRNSDHLYFNLTPNGGSLGGLVTTNKIDTTGFTKVGIEYSLTATSGYTSRKIFFCSDDSSYGYAYRSKDGYGVWNSDISLTTEKYSQIFDLPSTYNDNFGVFTSEHALSQLFGIRLYKAWLERG